MKKNIILNTFLICAAAFCLTSCSNVKNPNTTVIDNSQESPVSEIPEQDADGNKISVIEVTNAEGSVVTDSNKKPVTELAALDESGKIITDAEGKVSKPNLPAVTASKNNNNSNNNNNGNNNNGNNNNNNSNNAPVPEQTEKVETPGLEVRDELGNNSNYVAYLWFADAEQVKDDVKFDSITDDGDLVTFTFKVKDTARNGEYKIVNVSDNAHASTFCNADVKSLSLTYCPGTVYVGSDAAETPVNTDGLAFVISSASANPGDTVSLTGSIKNLKSSNLDIAAFNSYIDYDHDALEIVSVTRTDKTSAGDFVSNVK